MNTVMNLRVPLRVGNFLTSGGSIGFKKKFCSMELVVLTVCLPRWFFFNTVVCIWIGRRRNVVRLSTLRISVSC